LYNITITHITHIETYTWCLFNEVGARVGSMEEVKENKKLLYHFAVFAIVNELLNKPSLLAKRDEMRPSNHRGC